MKYSELKASINQVISFIDVENILQKKAGELDEG